MRPIIITQTGVGEGVHNTNWRQHNFKIGFGVVASGTVTYTVRHTFDSPVDFNGSADYAANADWFDHEFVVDQTASADGNYNYPIQGIKLSVTAGTGTATLKALQAL
jgi:hypothetical protein